MGTRADFYVGRGKDAIWLGSIGWDGYPDGGHPEDLAGITDRNEFLAAVGEILDRENGTLPRHGWPWPWDNSHLTDYSYTFDSDKVWCSYYGSKWVELDEWMRRIATTNDDRDDDEGNFEDWVNNMHTGVEDFPDMSDVQNVTFGPRSGIVVISKKD